MTQRAMPTTPRFTIFPIDAGRRDDWDTEGIVLTVDATRHAGKTFEQLHEEVRTQRNVVLEMIATLKPVKPVRSARLGLRRDW